MIAKAGAGTAETGVDLTFVAELLLGGTIVGTWRHVQDRGAQLTAEGLKEPLRDYSVLIVEVELSELRRTNGRQVLDIISHLTAVVGGVVQDIQGMVEPATGNARICPVVNVYARPEDVA